jgi:hypothetical protein
LDRVCIIVVAIIMIVVGIALTNSGALLRKTEMTKTFS